MARRVKQSQWWYIQGLLYSTPVSPVVQYGDLLEKQLVDPERRLLSEEMNIIL